MVFVVIPKILLCVPRQYCFRRPRLHCLGKTTLFYPIWIDSCIQVKLPFCKAPSVLVQFELSPILVSLLFYRNLHLLTHVKVLIMLAGQQSISFNINCLVLYIYNHYIENPLNTVVHCSISLPAEILNEVY